MNSISSARPVFVSLNTARLNLRQLTGEDEDALFAIRSNPSVNQYLDRPPAKSLEDVRAFIKKINDGITQSQWCYWAIILKNDSRLIGTICLWNFTNELDMAEIGFELNPGYQEMGFMQESLSAVIDFALVSLQLNSIQAITHRENKRSIHLLEKNGFVIDDGALKALNEKDSLNEETLIYIKRRNKEFQV